MRTRRRNVKVVKRISGSGGEEEEKVKVKRR